MAVAWTPHRFSGGVLALDTTNTVVLRHDPARTFDRFEDATEIARFASAASIHRREELGGRTLSVADPFAIRATVIAIREATDEALRSASADRSVGTSALRRMLAACAEGLAGPESRLSTGGVPFDGSLVPVAFETALSVSAISLLAPEKIKRIRICGNCGWLFVDKSRNSSRLWCDMTVCGNRQKARRHYSRHRSSRAEEDHVFS